MSDLPKNYNAGGVQSVWRGIAIPFKPGRGGYFAVRGVRDLVWSSILTILATPRGTRPHRRNFGSEFPELLFEPNDEVLRSLASFYITRAISEWEPRATLLSVQTEIDDTSLYVNIVFQIEEEEEPIAGGITVKRGTNFEVVNTSLGVAA